MTVGFVYVVETALANPQKEKITLCVCAADNLFFWFNTNPARHGVGQLPLDKDDHHYLTHDCFLDCSRVTTFPSHELDEAKPISLISKDLASKIADFLNDEQPKTLSAKQLALFIENLSALY